ncbi:MAG: NAD(P)-dependent oxidoreductase [Actinobacteria bacterium HGW-Actinobacteria-10]|nr:MAG: NAD(P)-dependent oxidoreductase [Actinobacteria bacterium HGW-Actinobacteria-10]
MKETAFPEQRQDRMPAIESEMTPRPEYRHPDWRPSGLLQDRTAVITGGDSGIGRAVAALFAAEGADIVIGYLDEHGDAEDTKRAVEAQARRCLTIAGDLSHEGQARELVKQATDFAGGSIDIFIQNASVQYDHEEFAAAPIDELRRVVDVNLLGGLFALHAAIPSMTEHGSIIVTTSVTAYRGSDHLAAYAATKGALASLVRSLGEQLAKDGLRVNGVAPGPVWTPLIVGSFAPEDVATFGTKAPMGRAAQPWEIAPSFLFLASERWSGYFTGQVLHPNGGEAVNA